MSLSPSNEFYVAGGTMRPNALSYVERQADRHLHQRLRECEFCYVLTPRQMGKSSLMARTARRLEGEQQALVAVLDLTQIGTHRGKAAAAQWYYGVARRILRQLEIGSDLQSWWRGRGSLPPLQRLFEFFSDVVLARTKVPIVIFVDEIDSTIPLPFAGDFFAAIRACHNERANDYEFRRLTFVLLGVASPSDLISDLKRTPFNVGHRIDLEDFSLQEAQPLARALPGDESDRKQILDRVVFWTGGHPYLTQRTLAELSAQESRRTSNRAVDETVLRVFISPPQHQADQNIAYVRRYLSEQPELTGDIRAIFHSLRHGDFMEDDQLSPVKSALKLSGLLKVGDNNQLIIRNRIYEQTLHDWDAGGSFSRSFVDLSFGVSNAAKSAVARYTTAKVVLLGDSGVGKTGLAWRLASGEFEDHSSTQGQQFWVLDQLRTERTDGTQCEVVLWDLAGQPDYRLIHQLSLDDVDLALVLFDPINGEQSLRSAEFWLRRFESRRHGLQATSPVMLVGTRSDRGSSQLAREELEAFCHQHGISGYAIVSAKEGWGIAELLQRMRDMIPWDEKPATISTLTFQKIKNYVFALKADGHRANVILTLDELRQRLKAADHTWKCSDAEILTAVGHLANHGYVMRLRTSTGEPRILLDPEVLNKLAASLVLEARRNHKGLGSLEERRLLSGGYAFPEMEKLAAVERDILLDSSAVLFLEHNICFRETDPLSARTYLVFPDLINLRKAPMEGEEGVEDGAAYAVSGAIENVYASLVVLLGYTHTFTRTNQWRNHARYEVGNRRVCGFRLEEERAGELDFVLYFGTNTDAPIRTLFQSLFESFLARRNLTVRRFEPVACRNGHLVNRAVVRDQMAAGSAFISVTGAARRSPFRNPTSRFNLRKDRRQRSKRSDARQINGHVSRRHSSA